MLTVLIEVDRGGPVDTDTGELSTVHPQLGAGPLLQTCSDLLSPDCSDQAPQGEEPPPLSLRDLRYGHHRHRPVPGEERTEAELLVPLWVGRAAPVLPVLQYENPCSQATVSTKKNLIANL